MKTRFVGELAKPGDPFGYFVELAGHCGTLSAALKILLQSPTNPDARQLCQEASDEFEAWWAANRRTAA